MVVKLRSRQLATGDKSDVVGLDLILLILEELQVRIMGTIKTIDGGTSLRDQVCRVSTIFS